MHSQAKPTRPTGMWTLANPTRFLELADRVIPWLAVLTFLTLGVGLYLAFFVAPPDYQQGETVRIMFVHVPAAWLAMFGYTLIAIASISSLIWRHPLADVAAKTAAPIGATFCFLALVTGSLWGKPMWGTYWVWDARLTSMLVLFLLYLGLIALWQSIEEPGRAGARRRHPRAGRLRQRADHQILGRLVEHAASACEHLPHRRPDHRSVAAHAALRHGRWLHAAVRAAAPHCHARRDPAPPRSCAPPGACRTRGGSLRPSLTAMPDLGPHAAFIWAAYAVTFIAVAGLVGVIVQDDRRQRQLLADLERQGITRRSAKPAAKPQPVEKKSRARKPKP